MEQELDVRTNTKLPIKSSIRSKPVNLREIVERAELSGRNTLHYPNLTSNMSKSELETIYNEYDRQVTYVFGKKEELFDDIFELCGIENDFPAFQPGNFFITRGLAGRGSEFKRGLKVDLSTLFSSGDMGSWINKGDVLYVSPDKTATLVYTDGNGNLEIKKFNCKLSD